MKYTTTIKHGNAISPYRDVVANSFHTEFAANLYGRLECTELCMKDQYYYWSVTKPPSGEVSGHLA